MYHPAGVNTSPEFPVSDLMKAWVLGGPDELFLCDKPTPVPGRAEVLVRIDAVAICATDLEISYRLAGPYQGRFALQQELYAGPRIHGYGRSPRS